MNKIDLNTSDNESTIDIESFLPMEKVAYFLKINKILADYMEQIHEI